MAVTVFDRGARVGTGATAMVAVRVAAVGVVAVALAALHIRRPATVCLLRATTGIPCPFCGGTTAVVRLGHADVRGALTASPLAVMLLAGWPFVHVVRAPTWWHNRTIRWLSIGAVLVVAEVWQLLRFGLIGV